MPALLIVDVDRTGTVFCRCCRVALRQRIARDCGGAPVASETGIRSPKRSPAIRFPYMAPIGTPGDDAECRPVTTIRRFAARPPLIAVGGG